MELTLYNEVSFWRKRGSSRGSGPALAKGPPCSPQERVEQRGKRIDPLLEGCLRTGGVASCCITGLLLEECLPQA